MKKLTGGGRRLLLTPLLLAAALALSGTPAGAEEIPDRTVQVTISKVLEAPGPTAEPAPVPPSVTILDGGEYAEAKGDYEDLYARVALVIDMDGVTGLYVTQTEINEGGVIVIPKFNVPGVEVLSVNVALCSTLEGIVSPTPAAVCWDNYIY